MNHFPHLPSPANAGLRRHALASMLSLATAALALPGWAALPDPDDPCFPYSSHQGNEHGDGNSTCTIDASAYGEANIASGLGSSAFGFNSVANGDSSLAVGAWLDADSSGFFTYDLDLDDDGVNESSSEQSIAWGSGSTAVGAASQAIGDLSVAVGNQNMATGAASSALGAANWALNVGASSVGAGNIAAGLVSNAFGAGNVAAGESSSSFGTGARIGSVAVDESGRPILDAQGNPTILSSADNAIAIGAGISEAGQTTVAGGAHYAIAIGHAAKIAEAAENAIAIGHGAKVQTAGAIALGADSVADRANTISVGAAGNERQIVNVAAGTQATDAVNLSQLRDTLSTANAYTDTAVATGGTQANAYTDNREAAVRSDMAAGDAATLSSANAYTDTRFNQVASLSDDFNAFRSNVDQRLHDQDGRIDRVGALGAAMVGMVASAAAVEGGRTRVGVAAGSYGGKQALSVGVQQRIGSRAAMTLGGAFSGSERSATVGVGFGF